jgi:DNA replication protein DnaC
MASVSGLLKRQVRLLAILSVKRSPTPTYADAILDRLVHNAYRFEMKGESMRRRAARQSTDDGAVDKIDEQSK